MAQEPVFQYTHVEAGLVENVVLRPTEATETYPSGWKYTLHLGTLEDLTLVRFDNAHEDTKGHEHHTPLATSTTSRSLEWRNYSSNSGRAQTSTGTPSGAIRRGRTDHTPPATTTLQK